MTPEHAYRQHKLIQVHVLFFSHGVGGWCGRRDIIRATVDDMLTAVKGETFIYFYMTF